jgi:hypothetical protein
MFKRLVACIFMLGLALWGIRASAQSYSWPTPASTPSPFVGIVTRPTPAPALPQLYLCYEDFNPSTFAALNPVECGSQFTTAAGNIIGTGVSFSTASQPSGTFPTTVNLVVNGIQYTNVPVNAATGMIGYAIVPGVQQLQIYILSTATYQGVSTNVTTH